MIDVLKEMFYRFKVKKYNKDIIASTKKREALKAKQKKQTTKFEEYKTKLSNIL